MHLYTLYDINYPPLCVISTHKPPRAAVDPDLPCKFHEPLRAEVLMRSLS